VLATFGLLSIVYGILVPFGEHPDETFHMSYVAWLARTHRLPDANQDDRPVREAFQPPLYYALAAIIWSALAPTEADDQRLAQAVMLSPNPAFGQSEQESNRYLHDAFERFPYVGWARQVELLRLALLPIAVATVGLTYRLGRLVRPTSALVPLMAAASVAYLPEFVFLSGSISNDLCAVLCSAIVLVALVESIAARRLTRTRCVVIGLTLGIGVLGKESMLTMVPVVVLGMALAARRLDQLAASLAWTAAPALALTGPLFIRNSILYGSVLSSAAQHLTMPYMIHAPRSPFSVYFLETAPTLWSSFVAHFGWLSIPLGRLRLPYDAFAVLAAVGALVAAITIVRTGPGSTEARLLALLVGTIVSALAGYVYHNLTLDSPQGRHLYTALPAVGVLLSLGCSQLADTLRIGPTLRHVAVAALCVAAPLYCLAIGWLKLVPLYGPLALP
jgi:hypothetical protein